MSSQYYDKDQVDQKLSQNLDRVEEVGKEVKLDVTKDVKAEVETFTASTTTKVNTLEGKVNQLDSKTTELNSSVAVYNQKVDNLNSAVSSETSTISIKPTDTATYLATLPNAVYRASSAGTYQFTTLPDFDVIVNKVVPEGYSVKFLKDASGWSVSVVEKLPEVVTTSNYKGMSDSLVFNQLGANKLYNDKISKSDLGYSEIPANTEFISDLIDSDINDTDLWGVGFFTTSGVVNSQDNFRYSKKYYSIAGDTQYRIKTSIYGNSCILIYDSNYNVIANIRATANTMGSTTTIDYLTPSNSKYIRISHFISASSQDLSVVNNYIIYIISDNVFVFKSTFPSKVREELDIYQIPANTELAYSIKGSDINNTELWGVGFFTTSGVVSATASTIWRYTKKAIKLLKGSYKIQTVVYGNAKTLILNLDGSVRTVLSGTNANYKQIFNITLDSDALFVTSQPNSADLTGTSYISITNTELVSSEVVTSNNIESFLPPPSIDSVRKILLDSYRPKRKRAMVTIISDDGRKSNDDWFIPILDEFKVKATFAIIGASTKSSDSNPNSLFYNSAQVRQLYNDGHDIASHTWTHTADWGIALTLDQIDDEMSKTKTFLENLTDTPVNMFVSPYGIRSTAIDNIISRYYDTNFISNYGTRNLLPLDNYFINRVSFDSDENAYSLLWDTTLENAIDTAIANKEWLVFAIHPHYNQYYNWENKEARRSELRTLLQYCKDNNVEVVTAKKGYEYWKNNVDIGVKRVNSSYYKLGMDMSEENINYFTE